MSALRSIHLACAVANAMICAAAIACGDSSVVAWAAACTAWCIFHAAWKPGVRP